MARAVIAISLLLSIAAPAGAQNVVRITGEVTDAQTGEPIERFWVMPGHDGPYGKSFDYAQEREFTNGQYAVEINRGELDSILCIEADGHAPVVSDAVSLDHDSTFDAKLRPGSNISGTVLTADGRPAADADVFLIGKRLGPALLNQYPDDKHQEGPRSITTAEGAFSFRPRGDDDVEVVALHDAGRGKTSAKQLAAGKPITLQPWAKIEGTLRFGTKPAKSQTITVSITGRSEPDRPYSNYEAVTDENGRFAFDRVPECTCTVGLLVKPASGLHCNFWALSVGSTAEVTTRAGQTMRLDIGGKGRPVVGRFDLPDEMPKDWTIEQASLAPPNAEPHGASHHFTLGDDGSFRIENVPPGDYESLLHIARGRRGMPTDGEPFRAWIRVPVTVPEIAGGVSDEPLDLGLIKMRR
jgi:hypothetical protein